VSVGEDETVKRLRAGFLRRAVIRIRELVAHGETDEALIGSTELRRYFEWIKEELPPGERGLLFQQIQTLPGTFQIRRDSGD